jgi:hypothetical protein
MDQTRINIHCAALIFAAGILTASCSEKSAPDRERDTNTSAVEKANGEDELRPDEDQIAEDCAAVVTYTKVVPARAARPDCPGCPVAGTAVLAFRGVNRDSISCSGETCTVRVTIRAMFNPGSGETLTGGLTAWIPPEQRSAYLNGHTPSGEQIYHVQITYKRRGEIWRAVEFDRPPVE